MTKSAAFRLIAVLAGIAGGCKAELGYRVVPGPDHRSRMVGPLRIEVTPVDTAKLGKDHPFRWRGDTFTGFMLFEVQTTNTSTDDLLCLVGHLDFPGFIEPAVKVAHLLPEAAEPAGTNGADARLVAASDLRLSSLAHEKASVLMESGYRHALLDHGDFARRYARIMKQDMKKAQGWAFVPYIGPFVAAKKMDDASEDMDRSQFRAEQKVLRPGVVPGQSTVKGYLVFAWPEDIEPSPIKLRLPVQPAHAVTFDFVVEQVQRAK